jgi:hypothetical protein
MKKSEINQNTFRKLESLKFLYEINPYGILRNVKSKKILNGYIDKDGYNRITFNNKNLDVKSSSIHRLVAEAFIPNPNNFPVINHKDENVKNNYYKNLEWCTIQHNNIYGERLERVSNTQSKLYGNILMESTGIEFNNSIDAAKYVIENKLSKSNDVKSISKNIRTYISKNQFKYGSKWKRLSL